MLADPKLLVVDDEEAICEGCRRIFARQGIAVEKTTNAAQGLEMAKTTPYAAVLLDIKMPAMDGIQFLEALRKDKPDLPVIFMTGYPSVPNAVAAVRLGASGYILKPFTPEEITLAVHKFIRPSQQAASGEAAWSPAEPSTYRWHEAWAQRGQDATVRLGLSAQADATDPIASARLPKIGEVVYQGLPLALLLTASGRQILVPAAVSGVVEGVNEDWTTAAARLANDLEGAGWIASVSATRWEEETAEAPAPVSGGGSSPKPGEPVSNITITNRNRTRVRLVAAPGILRPNDGLGCNIRRRLLDKLFPLETKLGEADISPSGIMGMISGCEHLVVLLAKDTGRLPGSLLRDTKSEFITVSGEGSGKVTTLVVQPAADGNCDFDARTVAVLAGHIVNDMSSY